MNLVKDNSPGGWAISVRCIGPRHDEYNAGRKYPRRGRMFTLAEGYADLDGEAFVAYYCDDCAKALTGEEILALHHARR